MSEEHTNEGFRPERLRQLREQHKLSMRGLAQLCGFSEALVRNYEVGANDPGGQYIVKLARQLDVSADYLLGLTDDPKGHVGDNQVTDEETNLLAVFRRDGWLGVMQLGLDHLSGKRG